MVGRKGTPGSFSEIFTCDFLLLATINLAMFFGFQMTNVGLPVYVAQLGANAQIVGLVGTLMTVTAVVVRIFAGPLLDRFGRKGALVVGSLVMACSIFAYAIFPIIGVILGIRLLQGIGWGLGSTASSTMAADVIPKKRFAEGMGYFAMTNSISSALAPAASVALVQGPGAMYMLFVSGGCAALAFVMALFQRNTVNVHEAPDDTAPADEGSHADDPQASEHELKQHNLDVSLQSEETKAQGAMPGNAARHAASEQQSSPSLLSTVFEKRAAFPGFLILLVNISFGCITSFITLHGQEQGIDNVSLYFIVYAIVTMASRPAIGRIIDRYGFRIPGILSCLATVATMVLIGLSRDTLMLSCAGVLAGLGVGTAMSVFQTMAVAAVEPWRRGVATSTYFVAFDVGIAIGSLTGGLIAGVYGYTIMYMAVAVFPLIAAVICMLSKKVK